MRTAHPRPVVRPMKRLSVFTTLLATTALLTLTIAAPALAQRNRTLAGSFGEGQLSLTPTVGESPGSGLAVDQSTHDLYVADTGNHRVEEFSAAGAFIRAWGWGVTNGAAEAQVCTMACLPGLSGTAPGQFETPTGIAVDNSPGGEGDVYISDYAEYESPDNIVQKFTSEGVLVKSWGTNGQVGQAALPAPENLFDISGVVVTPAGALLVGSNNGVFEFAQSSGTYSSKFSRGIYDPQGVALDGSGNLYFVENGGELLKFGPEGKELGVVFKSEAAPTGLAVNPETNELFVDEGDQISAIAPGCVPRMFAPFCERSVSFGAPQLGGGAGLAVDSGSHTVYAADTAAGRIDSFVEEEPGSPRVKSESLSFVTGNSATFGAEISPQSLAGEAATEYQFEYGACSSSSTCASNGYPELAPAVAGVIAPAFGARAVSVLVSDLAPGTTYHFRVLAHNAHNSGAVVEGEERVFSTQGAGGEQVLPDGRAWELVTPPNKQGALIEPISESGVVQAAASGSAITYLAKTPTELHPQGYSAKVQALSSRSGEGWSTRDIAIPHQSATGFPVGNGPEYKFFSEELSLSAVQPFGQFNPELSGEASESTAYLHSLASGCGESCYTPLVTGKPGFANVEGGVQFGQAALCEPGPNVAPQIVCGPEFLGASDDLGHVVLRAHAELKSGAGIGQLYEWGGGALSPVSVLPSGEPAPESEAHLGFGNGHGPEVAARRAISADGSLVVWGSGPDLYVRDVALKETVQLDEAEAACVTAAQCASGGGEFQIASVDGSRVFFTDQQRLSSDAGQAGQADLYECRIAQLAGKLSCELTDLTPRQGAQSAGVQGAVLGASEDGSWIYFVANGVLTSAPNARGEQAKAGDCESSAPFSSRSCNLYVRHGTTTSFIATLSGQDSHDWNQSPSSQPTRVSPNGEWLELMSAGSPTGYDNRDAQSGAPVAEVYLYDGAASRLSCASCEPSGARPSGVEYQKLEPGSGGLAGGPINLWTATGLVAANVPGTTAIGSGGQLKARYQPRYLSNSGRLFFNSADGLVAQDTNGTEDVYEYEPPGVGNCTSSSADFGEASGGCVGLISSGGSAQESAFLDASEDGSDVFFITAAKLSPLDVDASLDIYDAHECTSASPCVTVSTVQSPPCTTEASCKASPTPQPSIFGAPASATFQGLGNVTASKAVVKPKSAAQLRAEKLAKALKACKKDKKKSKRAKCEAAAHKKYGAKSKSKSKKSKKPTNRKGSK